jgi:hypothetical protein
MAESTEPSLLKLVEPWSTWVITPKTEAIITNDPLNKVNTGGQSLVKTLVKTPMSLNSLRNFLPHSPNFT